MVETNLFGYANGARAALLQFIAQGERGTLIKKLEAPADLKTEEAQIFRQLVWEKRFARSDPAKPWEAS